MKKLLPLLLALCLTLSSCAAPAAVPLPGDSVTAVTVTYAGKTVTCTDPAQVREIYKKCCAYMMVQPVLMEPRQSLGMEKFGYRDIFFTSNNYLFFLTNDLEFLLPDEVYTSLCQLIDEGNTAEVPTCG